MPTTPEPPSVRARTPPSPMHGPQYDNYRPYSARRTTRCTARSNPYASLNNEPSPKAHLQRDATPPPTTVKKARFARQPTQLSSPPSSPASPVRRRAVEKTPRKTPVSVRRAQANDTTSDSDQPSSSLAPPTADPANMLPTPSKTPKKRSAAAFQSTARILSFQPNNPNDVMPNPRKSKVQGHKRFHSTNAFDLYEGEREAAGAGIEIYTDANARVPQMDGAEDNPFVGPKMDGVRPQRRSARGVTAEDEAMEEASKRNEGVVYIFRGKKIFRRFSDPEHDRSSSAGISDISEVPGQRTLRRQAGAAAQRPLTRSAIKPRLLFPSEEQRLDRERGPDDVDEEAMTDIEMPVAQTPVKQKGKAKTKAKETPARNEFKPISPPSTKRTARATDRSGAVEQFTPIYEDEPGPMSVGSETFPTPGRRGGKSPFDSWPRTKGGRKRPGEAAEGAGSGKRTRAAAAGSPA